jgi:type II secretory pathway component PulF
MAASTAFTFRWKAVRPELGADGRRQFVTGEMQAPSEDVVRSTLITERDLTPESVEPRKRFGGETEWSVAKLLGRPSGKDMAGAYRTLASLVRNSVSLPEAVAAVADGSREIMVRETFGELRDKITAGYSIDEAMAQYPDVFDETVVELMRAAVNGGFVTETLVRIADMSESKNAIKKKIRGALIMPCIVLLAAMGVGIMMATTVIPELARMLEQMNPDQQMPLQTRALLWFSDNAIIILPAIFVLLVTAFIVNLKVLRHREDWQRLKSRAALRTPVLGKLTRLQSLATITRGLEMMLAAGVTMSEALRIIAPTVNNRIYREAVTEMGTASLQGRRLSDVMVNYPRLFDFAFVKMVKSGEESGSLDEMLQGLANETEEDVKQMADNMAELLNPLALLVVGFVLATLGMAMYGPIMEIAGSL